MIVAQRWIVVALCILLTGCVPICRNAKRTFWDEPRAFSWKKDREHSKEIYHSWAEKAWREQSASIPEVHCKGDYGAGFKEGFTEYVYAGGTGEPPPVPPRRYWNADLRSPRGHGAADQWFAGYRHGSSVAREGGYREQATLRSSLRVESVGEIALPQYFETPSFETPSVEPPSFPTESLPTEALPPLELPLEMPKIGLPESSAAAPIESASTRFIETADFLFSHETPERNVSGRGNKRSGNGRRFLRPTGKHQKPNASSRTFLEATRDQESLNHRAVLGRAVKSIPQTTGGMHTTSRAKNLSRRTIPASEPEPKTPEPKNSTLRVVSFSSVPKQGDVSNPVSKPEPIASVLRRGLKEVPSGQVIPIENPTETNATIQEESSHHFVF